MFFGTSASRSCCTTGPTTATTCAAVGGCSLDASHLCCRAGEAARDQPTAAPAEQGPAAGPAEQEAAAETQAERSKKFSKKLHRLRVAVQKAVREFSSYGATAAAELLPAEFRGVPPQIFVVGISPHKKLFYEASPAFQTHAPLDMLRQALRKGLENYQDTAVLASRAAASPGMTAPAPVVPQTAQLVQPRAVSEISRKQQLVRKHFNFCLKAADGRCICEGSRGAEEW